MVSSPAFAAAVPESNGKPYSILFHPDMTWIDKILTIVFSFLLPVAKMAQYSPTLCTQSKVAMDFINNIRSKIEGSNTARSIQKWSAAVGCPIGECIIPVPVNHHIFEEWGIVTATDESKMMDTPQKETVNVLVRFPLSSLPSHITIKKEQEKTADGCYKIEDMTSLECFDAKVPIILQFHGGGMITGSSNDYTVVEDTAALAATMPASSSSFITVDVDYSRAPEHPFPRAIIEACSVVDYLIQTTTTTNKYGRTGIHISGMSAGANLALVSAMEGHNRYPGKILTVQAQCPMLCPSASSNSYYLHSKASKCITVEWLRWCWRAYLALEGGEEEDAKNNKNNDSNHDKAKQMRGQNYHPWKKCEKWNVAPYKRLIDPTTTTEKLKTTDDKKPPIFLIITNKADPLRDDGIAMYNTLHKIASNPTQTVTLMEHPGSHFLGSMLDRKGNELRLQNWKDAILSF